MRCGQIRFCNADRTFVSSIVYTVQSVVAFVHRLRPCDRLHISIELVWHFRGSLRLANRFLKAPPMSNPKGRSRTRWTQVNICTGLNLLLIVIGLVKRFAAPEFLVITTQRAAGNAAHRVTYPSDWSVAFDGHDEDDAAQRKLVRGRDTQAERPAQQAAGDVRKLTAGLGRESDVWSETWRLARLKPRAKSAKPDVSGSECRKSRTCPGQLAYPSIRTSHTARRGYRQAGRP